MMKKHATMKNPASFGRFGDTAMAHVTPGEIIVPKDVQTPKVMKALTDEFSRNSMLVNRYRVGDESQSINPDTGYPEYFSLGKLFKKVAPIALPLAATIFAPGLGTALGTSLGIGSTAGGALAGAGLGAAGGLIGGGGLSGALQGAALGGVGGYLNAGGFGQLDNALGLSSGLGDFSEGLGLGRNPFDGVTSFFGGGGSTGTGSGLSSAYASPDISAARSLVSDAATSSQISNPLSGYLPGGGGSIAGGGSAGGFLSSLGTDPTAALSTGSGLTSQFASGVGNGLTNLSSSLPGIAGGISNAATSGGTDVLSNNLLKGLLKGGLSYAFQDDNTGGYNALQNAGNQSASNYQPFLTSGQRANEALGNLYGLNGADAAQSAQQDWQNTPGYQFALDQGIRALDASAASRGLALSGNEQQAIQKYGTGLGGQYYNQYVQDLQNQRNAGLGAAAGVNQGLTSAADAYAQLKANRGNNFNQFLGGLVNYI